MNVPFSSMIIYMNEKMKHLFKVKERDSMLNYYFCGGLAGCLASIPTTPFDVIKTKLNTQASLSNIEEKHMIEDIIQIREGNVQICGKNKRINS